MKRRGFTLIELMVVIAIIIILAAIAIPNYLNMTQRAKKSRIASDMATLATGLETFKTDWGTYPGNLTSGTADGVNLPASTVYAELGALGASPATKNLAANTNSMGDHGPIEYLKAATLKSIVDPFSVSGSTYANGSIFYLASSSGAHWVLFAYSSGDKDTGLYMWRSDSSSTVSEIAKTSGTKIDDTTGTVTN